MKKILLLFLLLLSIISCGKKEVLFSELQYRKDGLYYEINQKKPYSGTVLTKFENGQIKEETKMIKGVLQGEFSLYTENGDLKLKGQYIIGSYDYASDFSEGLAGVAKNGKYGYIDKTGKEVISIEFDYVSDFREDLVVVKKNKKLGYIDKTGKEVIPIEFDDANNFREGLAAVEKNGKYRYIIKP